MFSLRIISLYTAIACATLSSAAPLGSGSLALDNIPRADLGGLTGTLGNANPGGLLGLKLPASKRQTGTGVSEKGASGQESEKISGQGGQVGHKPLASKRQTGTGVTGAPSGQDAGKPPAGTQGAGGSPGGSQGAGETTGSSQKAGPAPRADATNSIPQIFSDATTKMEPIVAKLQAAIKVTAGAKVEIAVVVGLLNEIVVILRGAITQVNVLVKASLSVTVLLGSKTIAEVAIIIYGLLWIILQVLYAVVLVVGVAEVAVWAVVVIIGNLLVELLTITFGLVVGLQAAVIVLIQPAVITFITTLKFTALVTVLGVKA